MSVFSGFAKWKNNTNQVNLVLLTIAAANPIPTYFGRRTQSCLSNSPENPCLDSRNACTIVISPA